MVMTSTTPRNNEYSLIDSSDVSIKGNTYRIVLTNQRLILIENANQISRNVNLSDIQKIKPECNLNGDPSILLFIRSPSCENKRMVLSFIPRGSDNRQNERNQWVAALENSIVPISAVTPQEQNVSVYCSNCGRPIDSGSLFCNYCGTKIVSPSNPDPTYQNNRGVNLQSQKVSTEKISLPPRKTQQKDVNIPYSQPKEAYDYSQPNNTPRKRFHFSFPSLSSSKLPSDKSKIVGLCCGGVILLIIISAIFSTITHGATSTTSSLQSTTTPSEEPADAVTTYLFAFQKAGATSPVKLPASSLYNYLSSNVTAKTTKEEVGVVVSAMKTRWNIYDYSVTQTKTDGDRATVTVEITWQSNQGIQITRTETLPLVYEDGKWKLDEFFYSP